MGSSIVGGKIIGNIEAEEGGDGESAADRANSGDIAG
jgi:hypothetical protein